MTLNFKGAAECYKLWKQNVWVNKLNEPNRNATYNLEKERTRPYVIWHNVYFQLCGVYVIMHYIMAGRAFVVANEVFIMETVVFWHCDNG